MDVVIQQQLRQCTLRERIQIAIFLVYEIGSRLNRHSEDSDSSDPSVIVYLTAKMTSCDLPDDGPILGI